MLTRRDFLRGTASAAMGGAAMAMLGAASAAEESPVIDYASAVAETLEADVAVVGSGVSGLAAAVQAGELGLDTLLIEVNPYRGGIGPEGIAAIGSSIQREQGIDIAIGDVIEHDNLFFNYRLNTLFWQDMLKASAENIDWLIGKGVEFTGVVDEYKGMGKFKMFHWFPGDHNCAEAYSAHMEEAFLSAGGRLVLETRGRQLIVEGDRVVGLYATKPDESVVQINAKAIILATGGYGANYEMVAERFQGLYSGRWICDGMASNVGDGLNMAVAAGGVDVSRERCFLAKSCANTLDGSIANMGKLNKACWVSDSGERFTNEGCDDVNTRCSINSLLGHKNTYAIFDANVLAAAEDAFPDGLNKAIADAEAGDPELIMADSLEALAEAMGFDKALFLSQIQAYNDMCAMGEDTLYTKDPKYLVPIASAPFFAARQIVKGHNNIGGLAVNRDMQVIRWDFSPIEGLYAVGVESNMNYKETYTIEIPASCMCYNVASGRIAAKHAAKVL